MMFLVNLDVIEMELPNYEIGFLRPWEILFYFITYFDAYSIYIACVKE